jgi:hypothetical protein
MFLEIRLFIGPHGNQQSMCHNLSLLVGCLPFFSLLPPLFGFLLFLLGFISSLSQLAWEKGFDVVVVGL